MSNSRTHQEWLTDLNAEGASQEAAISELRNILLRAALFFFGRNQGDFETLSHEEILQRAEDCAQDALVAVMTHLPDFRGDSKFSTWAYKFAINFALMAARREQWKGVSLDELSDSGEDSLPDWMMRGKYEGVDPEQSALQDQLRVLIREVIDHDLTEKQREVLLMVVFNEVPMDVVVQHLGTNRNSVYKLLHDARSKLKGALQAHGVEVGETLAAFGAQG